MALPLADEILRRLVEADGAPLSGQRIADGLGVTRAAVWKGIESLRAGGYVVETVPARGYRFSSPPQGIRAGEVAARLKAGRLGRPVRYLDRVDSTNREGERWALGGAPEGALVLAEHQEAGRGRLGRSWADIPRKSLLFSLILRPVVPPADAPLLTYAAAIALAQAASRWVPPDAVEIKWPNDVLLGGRKVAGILLEMRCEAQTVEHLILGVGVNVDGLPSELPPDVRDRATTLAALAPNPPDRLSVLCAFVEGFEAVYQAFLDDGFEALRPQWNAWFRMSGRPVRIQTGRGILEGTAQGLGTGGALLLRSADGRVLPVYAGDVELATTRVTA
jgi:BirA family biotin operon repressor/biotin-[acetyl-CoA-carboxylase] ligase